MISYIIYRYLGAGISSRYMVLVLMVLCSCRVIPDTNIAPYSKIRSTPYIGETLNYLSDGVTHIEGNNTTALASPVPIRLGNTIVASFSFSLPSKLPINSIRLFQYSSRNGRRYARKFSISVDDNGNGRCDKVLIEEDNGVPNRWQVYNLKTPPVTTLICFKVDKLEDVHGPNYGGPILTEFEIYVPDDKLSYNAISSHQHKLKQSTYLKEVDNKALEIEDYISNINGSNNEINRGVLSSAWFYWDPEKGYDRKHVQDRINQLTSLGANRIWIYPHAYATKINYNSMAMPSNKISSYYIDKRLSKGKQFKVMAFPNNLLIGSKDNVLKRLIEQLHDANISVIVNDSFIPIGEAGWGFPRVPNSSEYPSLCSSYVREESASYYQSILDSNPDGLVLGGDEFFFYDNGRDDIDYPSVCKNKGKTIEQCRPTCAGLFYKTTGLKAPSKPRVFTEELARWKLFRYELVASWFARFDSLRDKNNPVIFTTMLRPGENKRTSYGIAYDVIGKLGKIDVMSSDPYWSNDNYLDNYYFANEVQKLLGATRTRKAEVTIQATPRFTNKEYEHSIMLVGPIFSSIMHGATGINIYRQDYLLQQRTGEVVKKIFNLIRLIGKLGFANKTSDKDVAVLYSRASEDWWYLRYFDNPILSTYAHLIQNAVTEVLFREGIDFDLYYLDDLNGWSELINYKAVILPFPYSVSQSAADSIKILADKGVKIIALNANGEVNEYGVEYETPLLMLISNIVKGGVRIEHAAYSDVKTDLFTVLRLAGVKVNPLIKNRNGKRVECKLRRHHVNKNVVVFCINWDSRVNDVKLGLKLDEGNYSIQKITIDKVIPLSFKGETVNSAEELREITLEMHPLSLVILYFSEVQL